MPSKPPRSLRAKSLLWPLVLLLAINCASCGDLRLLQYRDDALIHSYTYALGEKYLEVGGLKYCYQEMGRGDNVLILPGLGTNIDFWQLNIPALAAQHHVVALDTPGLGKSSKPDVPYDLHWMVDHILAFMDAKGLDRATVIGGSMGGHLAMIMALEHPQRVSGLVIMGSVGDWPPPTGMIDFALKNLWSEALCANVGQESWPEIYAKFFKHPTPMTNRIFRYQMALRANGDAYAAEGRTFSRALHSIFYSSVRDRVGEIACPVLLIWGQEDDIHPSVAGQFFHDHIPNSKLVIVPDAAHEAMVDQPDVFNSLVLELLVRVNSPAKRI